MSAGNGLPEFRPYVRGRQRPPWMLTALGPQMAGLALDAQRTRRDPDPNGVGYEWRREAEAEHAEPPCPPRALRPGGCADSDADVPSEAVPPRKDPGVIAGPEPKPRCGRCGYLVARCDCQGGVR
jgi:hypothetical protein